MKAEEIRKRWKEYDAVYVCDGVLILDDGNTSEEHEDTPENRERLIAEAQKYDEEWQRDRVDSAL